MRSWVSFAAGRLSTFALRLYRFSPGGLLPILVLLCGQSAAAIEFPPAPASRVNDYAGLLASSQREALDSKLADFERQRGTQMVIAIFPTLGEESLEDFSIRLASQWKLGRKGRDNGILMTLFMKERRIRIEVGYGLEDEIPDVAAGRIIREMAPYFRQNDHSGGLKYAAERLMALAGGGGGSEVPARPASPENGSFPWPVVWILVVILFSFLRASIPRRPTSGFHVDRKGRYPSSVPWWLPFIIAGSSRRSRVGGGQWGGGGGFGGGRGGGFGGGGASGRW
ncbi:MAG: TPM domain-containing protein [Acidobacteria bacterium]|nr:TPM domain-containing protein [Acidobacteriota bacterium]